MDGLYEIIITGTGGQGVMVMGQLLAHAKVMEEGNVVWFPSYGPETRGGMSSCTLVMSSDEVGSPVIDMPDTLIALDQVVLDKFAQSVKREGLILINSSLVKSPNYRSDCKIIDIPATAIADELGSSKVVNMVMLGAYIQVAKPVKLESVIASLPEVLPERYHKLIPLNTAAIEKGAEIAAGLM